MYQVYVVQNIVCDLQQECWGVRVLKEYGLKCSLRKRW